MKIYLSGAAGHMGRAVAAEAARLGVEIAGGVDLSPADLPFPLTDRFSSLPAGGEALIDFSMPSSLESLLAFAVSKKIPAVLCTTGYTEDQLRAIDEASRQIPIFRSGNMSVGIAVLRRLARQAAAMLGDSFDIEIVEAHHRRKADAPSGTALMLYDAVKDARGTESPAVTGRSGRDCRRQPGDIGLHAIRGGTVVGEHEVLFLGDMERITITHSAESRSVFAVGALRAAEFLIGREPGMYNMDDMLDLL